MSFAKVTIVGRLGNDPEIRYTQNGATVLSFRMAADGRRKGENVTWFAVSAWDRVAERLINLQEKGYLAKGSLLYVEGQLESRPYQDRSGNDRVSLDVTVTDFQFVGGGQQQQGDRRADARQEFQQQGEEAVDLDSVPF